MIVFEMHALAMGKWSLYKSGKGSCLRRAEELGRFPAYLARFYLLTGGWFKGVFTLQQCVRLHTWFYVISYIIPNKSTV